MKKLFLRLTSYALMLCTLVLIASDSMGQAVSINASGSLPDAQSVLDVSSTTKGVLLPRMSTAQRDAINPTAASDLGMVVYNTTTESYDYWDGSTWQQIPNLNSIEVSLDEAYDAGGSGSGRVITADAGAVDIQGTGGLLVEGITGIGTSSPDADYALSALKNSNNSVKIAGSSLGLLVEMGAGSEDGIYSLHTSGASSSTYYAIKGEVTNESGIGYLGYHTSGDNSYGVYGADGTYAGYFDGNTTVTGGNLGVGITGAATERLEVSGNIHVSGSARELIADNAFNITGTSGIDIIIDSDNNSTNAIFRVQKDAGTTLMELRENENFYLTTLSGQGASLVQADNAGQVTHSGIDPTSIISGSGTATQVAYFDADQNITSNTNLFWDEPNSRLGIRTNVPSSPLEVRINENSGLNYPLHLKNQGAGNSGTNGVGIGFNADNISPSYVKNALYFERLTDFSRGKFHILMNNTASTTAATLSDSRLTILSANGNVGIGETTPAAKFHINGTAGDLLKVDLASAQRFLLSAGGDLTITGKFNSNGVEELSDIRFKKNIQPLSNVLSRLTALEGVTYNWRTEEFPERAFGTRQEIGLIAQEVEKLFPELVSTDAKGYKAVQYSHLVPVLVEAIKDQQILIGALEEKVDRMSVSATESETYQQTLEQRLDSMSSQLNMLMSTLDKAEK